MSLWNGRLWTHSVSCSSDAGEKQEKIGGPLPASRLVIDDSLSPLRFVELLTASPLQFIKPPLDVAPVAYRIPIPSKIPGSDSVLDRVP